MGAAVDLWGTGLPRNEEGASGEDVGQDAREAASGAKVHCCVQCFAKVQSNARAAERRLFRLRSDWLPACLGRWRRQGPTQTCLLAGVTEPLMHSHARGRASAWPCDGWAASECQSKRLMGFVRLRLPHMTTLASIPGGGRCADARQGQGGRAWFRKLASGGMAHGVAASWL